MGEDSTNSKNQFTPNQFEESRIQEVNESMEFSCFNKDTTLMSTYEQLSMI